MQVKLKSHSFPDRPDWIVINPTIPIGTVYELLGYDRDMELINSFTLERRKTGAYLVSRNGITGYLPVDCFEAAE